MDRLAWAHTGRQRRFCIWATHTQLWTTTIANLGLSTISFLIPHSKFRPKYYKLSHTTIGHTNLDKLVVLLVIDIIREQIQLLDLWIHLTRGCLDS
jgi:hypothetical protein